MGSPVCVHSRHWVRSRTRAPRTTGERWMTKTDTDATVKSKTTTDGEGSLEIRDTRTGKTYTVPITDGTIRALDLRAIKTGDEDFGMMTYDPAFMNTASCRSAITF